MHNLLVGYLLGDIGEDERRLLRERLRRDPQLRKQLEHLAGCLGVRAEANAEFGDDPPPADLAQRTSERVAYAADSGEYDLPTRDEFSSLGFAPDPSCDGSSGSRWTVADLTVATGVVLAIGMLLIPALRDSRCMSRRLQCENNLREIGFALANFAISNRNYMPIVQPNENAGIYSTRLADGGFVERDKLARIIICPASPLADQIATGQVRIYIPSGEALRSVSGQQRVEWRRHMGGSYAYHFGFVRGNRYSGRRNSFEKHVAVLADSPSDPVEYTSYSHGGNGENVLFQDLSVRYLRGTLSPYARDHIFLNNQGLPIASRHPDDSVLGSSAAMPGVRFAEFPFRE